VVGEKGESKNKKPYHKEKSSGGGQHKGKRGYQLIFHLARRPKVHRGKGGGGKGGQFFARAWKKAKQATRQA